MSRVYFVSATDEAEVRGSERYWAGGICSGITLGALGYTFDDPLLSMVNKEWARESEHNYTLWLRSSGEGDNFILPSDPAIYERLPAPLRDKFSDVKEVNVFNLGANTALVTGSDPIKFMARMHYQCEIHTWVDGPNRAWLADIIKQGLATSIMRHGMGWTEVIKLFESSNKGEVVTSFSTCEGFPSRLRSMPEARWYDLPREKRWDLGIRKLRKKKWLEMKPDDWNTFYFDNGINAYDMRALAYEMYQMEQERKRGK